MQISEAEVDHVCTMEVSGRLLKMDPDVYDFLKDKRVEFTGGGYPMVRLHSMFFEDIPDGMVVDHINRDIGDFTRHNLRVVTYSDNNRNRSKSKHTGSKYKGVHWSRSAWVSKIHVNSREVFLNRWSSEEEAAVAWDIASLYFFPHLNLTNFPLDNYKAINIKDELHKIVSKPPRNNTSGYRGVFRTRNGKEFYSHAKVNGKTTYLGKFSTAEEAARVHDEVAKSQGCRTSRLNFFSIDEWLREVVYEG